VPTRLDAEPAVPTVTEWLLLALGILATGASAVALVRTRRPALFAIGYFALGWATGELTFGVFTAEAVAAATLIALGGMDSSPGPVGLGLLLASWIGLVVVQRRKRAAGPAIESALIDGLGPSYRAAIPPDRRADLPEDVDHREPLGNPFRPRDRRVEVVRDLAYGDDPAQRLDVYRHRDHLTGSPVLVHVHGGAWTTGRKEHGGVPLLEHLASRGWVGVAATHRRSPRVAFPDHLIDVKRVLAWVQQDGPSFGMDPGFVVLAGQSSGAHLAALAAFSPGDPRYQPGFESVDTAVAGCVACYGNYDFCNRFAIRGRTSDMGGFLERYVMQVSRQEDPTRWDDASPVARVRADAPPFLVIHGTHDSLLWVEEARRFVDVLRATSQSPVTYAEIPDAQHAFDIFPTLRSLLVVHGMVRWLEHLVATTR
jgi:acetyl esterase/lipase